MEVKFSERKLQRGRRRVIINASTMTCIDCGEQKELTEFYKITGTSNYHRRCKTCYKIYQRANYRRRGNKFTRLSQEQKNHIKTMIDNNETIASIAGYLNVLPQTFNYWRKKGFLDEL